MRCRPSATSFVMKQMGRGFVKVGAEKPDPEDVRWWKTPGRKRESDPVRRMGFGGAG